MATTYSGNLRLGKPAVADRNWNTAIEADLDALDVLSPIATGNVTIAEVPSASLNVRIAGGSYLKADGTVGTLSTVSAQPVTASTTTYVFLDSSYAVAVNTTGWPSTAHIRLATVLAGTTTITSIADARVILEPLLAPCLPLSGGTLADAANVAVGTTTGTKIATAASQKLGFYGATPVVQPSGSAQAALTDSTTGTAGTTLANVGTSFSQSTLNNNFASLANLVNAIRSALVAEGIIKGSS